MAQLIRKTYAANEKERAAVDKLLDDHGRSNLDASVARTEPGESGPLQVTIGRRVWTVSRDGKTKEAKT